MISFSSRMSELLSRPSIETFYMVQIGVTTRMVSLASSVELSDGRVYLSGDLVSLDPPRLASSVDRSVYRITLADPRMEYGVQFEGGMVGAQVEVLLGLIDMTTGQPETDINNVFVIYRGAVDEVSYKVDLSNSGSSLAMLTCASPMANLDMSKPFYTSKDFIRQINVNDSSFDQIYAGSGAVQLKWGKT